MSTRTIVFCTLITAAALLAACGVIGRSGNGLKFVPDDATTVVVFDVAAMLSEEDVPDAISDEFEQGLEDIWEELNISLSELDTMTISLADNSAGLIVISGQFDVSDLREGLEDNGYEEDTYRGFELWTGGFVLPNLSAVAVMEEEMHAILGETEYVQDVLKSANRSSGMLIDADNSDLKRVMDKAGSGLIIAAGSCEVDNDIVDLLEEVEDCEAIAGAVYSSDDEYAVGIKIAVLFGSEREAQRTLDEIEDGIDSQYKDAVSVDVKVDGEFVIADLIVDEEDFDF